MTEPRHEGTSLVGLLLHVQSQNENQFVAQRTRALGMIGRH